MSLIQTKVLLAIVAALAVIAGVVTRREVREDQQAAAMKQFYDDVQRCAAREGYGLGDVSKTIRRSPR